MSAAAVVKAGNKKLFVKRHHSSVRSVSDIRCEHAFIGYLHNHAIKVPHVYSDENGETAFVRGEYIYEVSDALTGEDLYKDRMSWSYYFFPKHAYNAGKALANLHLASERFSGTAKDFGPLCNSAEVIVSGDPLAKLQAIIGERPVLAGSILQATTSLGSFFERFSRVHLPFIEKLAGRDSAIKSGYTHGDWHPSNMSWTDGGEEAEVDCIFDFGLSNLTFLQHDIALALERSCIDWLGISGTGWDRAGLIAFLRGYDSVKELSPEDLRLVADVLPVCHLEYALSEAEYFGGVLNRTDNVVLAYETYLFGHSEFFRSPEGTELQETVANFKR